MNSLTRDSVILTVAPLAVVCTVGTIFLASAQPLPTLDPEICATSTSDVDAEASFLAENGAAMKKMMGDMAVKPTGERSAGEEIAGDVVQPKALSEIMKCAGRFHADTFKFGPERSVGAPAPLRVGS